MGPCLETGGGSGGGGDEEFREKRDFSQGVLGWKQMFWLLKNFSTVYGQIVILP